MERGLQAKAEVEKLQLRAEAASKEKEIQVQRAEGLALVREAECCNE